MFIGLYISDSEKKKAINAKYGANLKSVNVGLYRILYPASL